MSLIDKLTIVLESKSRVCDGIHAIIFHGIKHIESLKTLSSQKCRMVAVEVWEVKKRQMLIEQYKHRT